MKVQDYAYPVARIRANEVSLLTPSDLEQLIGSDRYETALRLLSDRGWMELDASRKEDAVELALSKQMQNTWHLLEDIAPDLHCFDFLIVKNDYANLKAVLKLFVREQLKESREPVTYRPLFPSIADPDQIRQLVFEMKFDRLPVFLVEAAKTTYDVLIHTQDGQQGDILLDAYALRTSLQMARNTDNRFILELARQMVLTADLKIALRAARAGKEASILRSALVDSEEIDFEELIHVASSGPEEVLQWIKRTKYAEAADRFEQSPSAFEKWCDDLLMHTVEQAKYVPLGIEPLIAYYIAKEAEIKNIRILLSGKRNHVPEQTIRERLRTLYV